MTTLVQDIIKECSQTADYFLKQKGDWNDDDIVLDISQIDDKLYLLPAEDQSKAKKEFDENSLTIVNQSLKEEAKMSTAKLIS